MTWLVAVTGVHGVGLQGAAEVEGVAEASQGSTDASVRRNPHCQTESKSSLSPSWRCKNTTRASTTLHLIGKLSFWYQWASDSLPSKKEHSCKIDRRWRYCLSYMHSFVFWSKVDDLMNVLSVFSLWDTWTLKCDRSPVDWPHLFSFFCKSLESYSSCIKTWKNWGGCTDTK